MANAVEGMNGEICERLREMKVAEGDMNKFTVEPRRSSEKENLKYTTGRKSLPPQVLIMCMNPTSIKKLQEHSSRATDLALAPLALLSGIENSPFLMKCASPHTPVNTGVNRPRPRLVILSDEDDLTRSVSSTGAAQNLNWSQSGKPTLPASFLQQVWVEFAQEENDDDGPGSGDEGASGDEDDNTVTGQQMAWLAGMKDLRTTAYLVVSITATPAALLPGQDGDGIQYNVVQLNPPKTYIGYSIAKHFFPYLERGIEVKEVKDREIKQRVLKTAMYKRVLQNSTNVSGASLWDDGSNEPTIPGISVNKNGTLSISKKAAAGDKFLGWLRDMVDTATRPKAAADGDRAGDTAWAADGENITTMLTSMESEPTGPGLGRDGAYRNALITSNYTKSQSQQAAMRNRLLAMSRDPGCDAISKLIVVEYFHRHVRVSWNCDEHVTTELLAAFMEGTAQGHTQLWAGSKKGTNSNEINPTTVFTFKSSFSNINHVYSCLWRYHQRQSKTSAIWKLKIVSLTGSIGGRGVRYKGDDHEFVLTDMYYAFAVRSDRAPSMHGELAIQTVGRLCTLVRDLASTPRIRLWTPTNCARLIHLLMQVQYQFVHVAANRQTDETFEAALARVLDAGEATELRNSWENSFSRSSAGKQFHLSSSRLKVKEAKIRCHVIDDDALGSATRHFFRNSVGLDYEPERHLPATMDSLLQTAARSVSQRAVATLFVEYVHEGCHIGGDSDVTSLGAGSAGTDGAAAAAPSCILVTDPDATVQLSVAVGRFLHERRQQIVDSVKFGEIDSAASGAYIPATDVDSPSMLTRQRVLSIVHAHVHSHFVRTEAGEDVFNVGDTLSSQYVVVTGLASDPDHATVRLTRSAMIPPASGSRRSTPRSAKRKEQPSPETSTSDPTSTQKSKRRRDVASAGGKKRTSKKPMPEMVGDTRLDKQRREAKVAEWIPGSDDEDEEDEWASFP
jgi:hypothetical protein